MTYFIKQNTTGETVLKANIAYIKTAFLCCVTLSLYALPANAQSMVLKVCYDQWPPMTIFPTQDEPRRGVVIDMLTDIYTNAGYTLEYFPVPLARGMSMIEEGLCDILPEIEFSPNSENNFVYAKQATFTYPTAFVVRRNDPWRYTGIESVANKRIATGPGWNYQSMSKPYQNHIENPANSANIEIVAGDGDVVPRIFKMIASNRVDIYADNVFVLKYLLSSTALQDQLEIVSPGLENALVEKPIFSLMLPEKKRQNLMNIWDQGRKTLHAEQEAKYLERYGISGKISY
jgi:polar amino acid transport system substrate-binding protein